MSRHNTLLEYDNHRYLKVSAALAALAILAYVATDPTDIHSFGRTWVGYGLGIASALIVLFQMVYSLARCCMPIRPNRRKPEGTGRYGARSAFPVERRNRDRKPGWVYGSTLQGWLSAHVHLGSALLVTATLHSGFQFGWNVYTLTYVLLVLVILSGFFGAHAYLNYPTRITQNMGNDTLGDLLLKIGELDELAIAHAARLPDKVGAPVTAACGETRLGGNLFEQLMACHVHCPTKAALERVQELGAQYTKGEQSKLMQELYAILLRKEKLMSRARTDIMLNARLGAWLYLHVPLSIALLAALATHIVAIFFFR